jgi:hypothetical protein
MPMEAVEVLTGSKGVLLVLYLTTKGSLAASGISLYRPVDPLGVILTSYFLHCKLLKKPLYLAI